MATITQEQVDAALDTAVKENGYTELMTWDPGAIALDLVEHTREFDDVRPSSLQPFIRDWKKRHGGELVEIVWQTGPVRKETVSIPQAAIVWTEVAYIQSLEKQLAEERLRANAYALQTILLGRHLNIAVKSLEGMRGVIVAVNNLRRFGGDPKLTGNPLDVAAEGFLAMQDGKELDAAMRVAAEAMEQLENEYPVETGLDAQPG